MLADNQPDGASPDLPAVQASRPGWRGVAGSLVERVRHWWSCVLFPADAPPLTPTTPGRFWTGFGLVALIAGWLLLTDLSYPLLEPDEGRYAEVVREMAAHGEWVVPTLHREPFYDKPPLFYWLVAGSYRLFGTNELAARLVPALAAFLTVLATMLLSRGIVGPRGAVLAGVALAVMPAFVQAGRIVILDSLLTCCVTVGMLTGYRAIQGARLHWGWWLASALAVGLGVLTKGPVALVLFLPPVVAYGWLNRSTARPSWRHWAVYLGLVFALVAPWYVLIIARDPSFAYHFFIDQHLVRFLMREYHVEPFWYYIPVLLVGCLPWSFVLIPAMRSLWSRAEEVRLLRDRALGFFTLWAGWCVLFFSISSSKLPPYVLPAVPALALLVGAFLDRTLALSAPLGFVRQVRTVSPRWAAPVMATVWLVVSIGAWQRNLLSELPALLHTAAAVVMLLVGLMCGWRVAPRMLWSLAVAATALLSFEIGHEILPNWSLLRSPLRRYDEIAAYVDAGPSPVACLGGEWGSISFYLGRDDIVFRVKEEVPSPELLANLGSNRHYVVVGRYADDVERWDHVMPRNMHVSKLLHADKITVAFVEVDCPTPEH